MCLRATNKINYTLQEFWQTIENSLPGWFLLNWRKSPRRDLAIKPLFHNLETFLTINQIIQPRVFYSPVKSGVFDVRLIALN